MHRRIVYRVTAAFVMSLVLLSGCSGVRTGQGEELKELTDTGSEEVQEDKSAAGVTKEEELEEPLQEEMQCTDDSQEVYVHVCGQVACPGVYLLPAGSRLYEAIEAAGGLSENGACRIWERRVGMCRLPGCPVRMRRGTVWRLMTGRSTLTGQPENN